MTGMAKRGVPVALARAGVEVTVLVAGWLLGGTVGIATVLFAASHRPAGQAGPGPPRDPPESVRVTPNQ